MTQYNKRRKNWARVLVFFIYLTLIGNAWSKTPVSYTYDVLGDFHIKEWKLKPQYVSQDQKILNNIQLFLNLSSHEPFFGESGDAPWSWKYSACEVNPLVSGNRSTQRLLTKRDFYLPTNNFQFLYSRLRIFSELQCRQTQIIADFRGGKMQRLFNVSPSVCQSRFINKFKTDKDLVSVHDMKKIYFGSVQTLQNIGNLFEENVSRWRWFLGCTTDELYPSNTILDNSMVEYVGFFDQLIVQSTYDEQCTIDLKSINKDFLKAMSTKCPKPNEP